MASLESPVSKPMNEVSRPSRVFYFRMDVALRVLLFSSSLVAVVLLLTSNQTNLFPVPGKTFPVKIPAKFTYFPAFNYLLVALSAACLYSIITVLVASVSAISKLAYMKRLLNLFAFLDVLMLGIVASAVGAALAVGYIAVRGNSHARWNKVPTAGYEKFIQHLGTAIALSMLAVAVLVALSMQSIYSLYKQIRNFDPADNKISRM